MTSEAPEPPVPDHYPVTWKTIAGTILLFAAVSAACVLGFKPAIGEDTWTTTIEKVTLLPGGHSLDATARAVNTGTDPVGASCYAEAYFPKTGQWIFNPIQTDGIIGHTVQPGKAATVTVRLPLGNLLARDQTEVYVGCQ